MLISWPRMKGRNKYTNKGENKGGNKRMKIKKENSESR
jgi:hypothetical protein